MTHRVISRLCVCVTFSFLYPEKEGKREAKRSKTLVPETKRATGSREREL